MTKSNETVAVSIEQIRAWWPNNRGELIVALTSMGLPYWRAVIRSRRYYVEGRAV